MALTVEELQIVLSCDATTAQAVLEKMDATVKAYTQKFQKYFNTMGGKGGGSKAGSGLDNVVKNVERQTKRLAKAGADWKKQYEKTFGETFDSSMMKAKIRAGASSNRYSPSGKKYVGGDANGRGGGFGTAYNKEFAKARASATPDNKLLDLGAEQLGRLEGGLEQVKGISDAVRQKIIDARAAVQDFGKKYVDAVKNSGNGSKAANKAEADFKKAIYAADKYAETLEKLIAKENPGQGVELKWSRISGFISSAIKRVKSFGAAVKKAFNNTLLGKFLQRLKTTMLRMAAMRLIRGTIDGAKQGLEQLAKTSASSAKAMNTIKAAGGSVKMALGAALMPVVKALAPLFINLAGAISTACNAIARFFAVLTGQSTYTAVNFSGALDGISDSASGAGSAVKGMLADFDELNVLTKSGGGGGGGSTGVEQSLSTVEDLAAHSDLATLFEEGKFFEIGQRIQTWLGSINEKFTDWLDGFQELHIGEKFAELINGFFAPDENGNYPVLANFGENLGKFLGTLGANLVTMILDVNWGDVAGAFGEFVSKFWAGLKDAWDKEMERRRQEGEFVPGEGPGAGWVGSDTDDPTPELGGDMLTPEEFAEWWEDYKKKVRTALGLKEGESFFGWLFKSGGWTGSDTDDPTAEMGELPGGQTIEEWWQIVKLKWEKVKASFDMMTAQFEISWRKWYGSFLESLDNPIMQPVLKLLGIDLPAAIQRNKEELHDAQMDLDAAQISFNALSKTIQELSENGDVEVNVSLGSVKPFYDDMNKKVTGKTSSPWKALTEPMLKEGDAFIKDMNNKITGKTSKPWQALVNPKYNNGKDFVKDMGDKVTGKTSTPWQALVNPMYNNGKQFVKDMGDKVTGKTSSPWKALVDPKYNSGAKFVSSMKEHVTGQTSSPWQALVDPKYNNGTSFVNAMQKYVTGQTSASWKALVDPKYNSDTSFFAKLREKVTGVTNYTSVNPTFSVTAAYTKAVSDATADKTLTVNASLSIDKTKTNNAIENAMKGASTKVSLTIGGETVTGDIKTYARGGIAYGTTSAIIGEYVGAKSNPEVVAPLSKLQGILERSNVGSSKDTMTREQANTMIGLLRELTNKETVVRPSVELGQVVDRSLKAYART